MLWVVALCLAEAIVCSVILLKFRQYLPLPDFIGTWNMQASLVGTSCYRNLSCLWCTAFRQTTPTGVPATQSYEVENCLGAILINGNCGNYYEFSLMHGWRMTFKSWFTTPSSMSISTALACTTGFTVKSSNEARAPCHSGLILHYASGCLRPAHFCVNTVFLVDRSLKFKVHVIQKKPYQWYEELASIEACKRVW